MSVQKLDLVSNHFKGFHLPAAINLVLIHILDDITPIDQETV